jgi:hypothetical protein
MCTYAAKKFEKREQLVSTAVFDASYLCLCVKLVSYNLHIEVLVDKYFNGHNWQ